MLDLPSTIEMMRALSLSADANDLAQVFGRYLRDTTSLNRGLVIHRRGVAPFHYRVELCADWDAKHNASSSRTPTPSATAGFWPRFWKPAN